MRGNKTQTAVLNSKDGITVARVVVPAFPDNPEIIRYNHRFFHNGMLGYGTTIVYIEGAVYEAYEATAS